MSVPPLWPWLMPLCADVRSNTGELQDQVHRFRPEQGLPIRRRMQTATLAAYSLGFSGLEKDQMDAFYDFYDVTLQQGTLPFAWVHPRRHLPREISFAAPPREARLAASRWSLALEVEFIDIAPGWIGDVTIANGVMAQV